MVKTIYALATAPGMGAIHIIRVSGPKTFCILQKVCKQKIEKKHFSIERNTIYNFQKKQEIDDVLLMKFLSPKTYTGEDLVEINCHGNMQIVNEIFRLLSQNGADLATPGEFTKRGFMNNKIDLTQAAAVDVLVKTKNPFVRSLALDSILGKTSLKLKNLQNEIFKLIGSIEVLIDYPEFEDVTKDFKIFDKQATEIKKVLENVIIKSSKIISLDSGFKIAIIGRPNVGKSSLLNALLKKDRALVSSQAGTTRDVVEAQTEFNGFPVSFLDTAGIHKHRSQLEKMGIIKTYKTIDEANLVIFLTDVSKKVSKDELDLISYLKQKNKKYVICQNKKDLVKQKTTNKKNDVIQISAKQNEISQLLSYLEMLLKQEQLNDTDALIFNREWQLNLARSCILHLEEFIKLLKLKPYLDLIIEPLKQANEDLLKIVGEIQDYDLISEIFKTFCLGK